MSERLGVFGGTFDPIHLGHLVIAECARHELGLSRVMFMPARLQPHKLGQPVTPPEHRWAMVQLAIAGNAAFCASRIELDHEGPSYTSQSLAGIRAAVPESQELYFVCGADSLLDVATWHRPDELVRLAALAVARRPGCERAELDQAIEQLRRELGARIIVFEAPLLEISSTLIRTRTQDSRPIRYLVPSAVAAYVAEHGLYRP